MNAGRLRHRPVFEKKTITYTGDVRTETWAPDTSFSSDGSIAAEAVRLSERVARFAIYHRDTIGPETHRILFWGSRWTITSAVRGDGRDYNALFIESDFSDKIEVTHLQSETREHLDGLPLIQTPQ